MTQPGFLEDFGLIASFPSGASNEESDQALDIRLEGFDAGYEAGFEDAKKLHSSQAHQVQAELLTGLEELKAGLGTVQEKFFAALCEPLSNLLIQLLPEVSRMGLREAVQQILSDQVKSLAAQSISLRVHPLAKEEIARLLEGPDLQGITVEGDDGLAIAEAEIVGADSATFIDLETAKEELISVIQAYFSHSKETSGAS